MLSDSSPPCTAWWVVYTHSLTVGSSLQIMKQPSGCVLLQSADVMLFSRQRNKREFDLLSDKLKTLSAVNRHAPLNAVCSAQPREARYTEELIHPE